MKVTTSQSWITVVAYFAVFIGIFYVMVIMPRKRQEKKHSSLVANLSKGDKIVTIGGVNGVVTKIKENTVMIKVSDNTEMEFLKKAIAYKTED